MKRSILADIILLSVHPSPPRPEIIQQPFKSFCAQNLFYHCSDKTGTGDAENLQNRVGNYSIFKVFIAF